MFELETDAKETMAEGYREQVEPEQVVSFVALNS